MTRGHLPPGVYWRRRLFVLGLGAALVVLVAGLLRGGSDASSATDPTGTAEQAAGVPLTPPSSFGPTTGLTAAGGDGSGKKRRGKPASTPTTPPLAQPSGPCEAGDVVVEPVLDRAVAGSDVPIVLELRTVSVEACTWRISSKHVTVTITSGSDEIWASRKCPRTVPVTDEVIRRDVPVRTTVVWNAQRSNLGCPGRSQWALPGYYHVAAAALGGEPSDVQFQLVAPQREVVTVTPSPTAKPQPGSKPKSRPGRGGATEPTPRSN